MEVAQAAPHELANCSWKNSGGAALFFNPQFEKQWRSNPVFQHRVSCELHERRAHLPSHRPATEHPRRRASSGGPPRLLVASARPPSALGRAEPPSAEAVHYVSDDAGVQGERRPPSKRRQRRSGRFFAVTLESPSVIRRSRANRGSLCRPTPSSTAFPSGTPPRGPATAPRADRHQAPLSLRARVRQDVRHKPPQGKDSVVDRSLQQGLATQPRGSPEPDAPRGERPRSSPTSSSTSSSSMSGEADWHQVGEMGLVQVGHGRPPGRAVRSSPRGPHLGPFKRREGG